MWWVKITSLRSGDKGWSKFDFLSSIVHSKHLMFSNVLWKCCQAIVMFKTDLIILKPKYIFICWFLTRSKFKGTGPQFVNAIAQNYYFQMQRVPPAPHRAPFLFQLHVTQHRAVRWESSVLNWGVCLDRLDKYFFCVVVSSPLFSPDSHRRGVEQSKLHNIMVWVADPCETHGRLASCLCVYPSPLGLGIN